MQGKRFVYVVNEKDQVISSEIKITSLAAGQYFVVTEGLKAGDRVVYETANSLADSTAIKPEMAPENKVYGELK